MQLIKQIITHEYKTVSATKDKLKFVEKNNEEEKDELNSNIEEEKTEKKIEEYEGEKKIIIYYWKMKIKKSIK